MIATVKIRLLPTEEQETLMWKSVGIARYAYNWGLAQQRKYSSDGYPFVHCRILRDQFVTLKQKPEYFWLNEVSAQVIARAFEDLQDSYNRFFSKTSGEPKFKSKRKSKASFYARYDTIKFLNGAVKLEKLGLIKYRTNYYIPKLKKYINPRVSHDGKYWYLTLGYEVETSNEELTDESVGVDLGLKNLAVVSNIDKPFKNINKVERVKKIEKRLKRLQRQVSRKYECNKQGKNYIKTKNIVKCEKKIKLLYRRLSNIRLNHVHHATYAIVKTKPSRVVMENLNVRGMMKNKYLAKAIKEQCFYEFRRQLEYKCEYFNIEFILADQFFPSSKMCSCCGNIKEKLKLSERTYTCDKCGFTGDRDKNASINLANYKLAN